MTTTKVFYSCDICGVKDIEIQVRQRAENEDISRWMENLAYSLSRDHDKRSPRCKVKSLTQVKIPLHEGTPIGGEPRQ